MADRYEIVGSLSGLPYILFTTQCFFYKIQVIIILNSQAHPITSQNQKTGIPNISQDAIFQDGITIGQVVVEVFLILELNCVRNFQPSRLLFVIFSQWPSGRKKLLLFLFNETILEEMREYCITLQVTLQFYIALHCIWITFTGHNVYNTWAIWGNYEYYSLEYLIKDDINLTKYLYFRLKNTVKFLL